jgi:PAS domain S-box-containing protein
MGAENRRTGLAAIGDAPWGTHFCLFYQTQQDLIDILTPYFAAGLENNESCMWVTSDPLNVADARKSLATVVKDLDAYFEKGQIEILDYSQWYTRSGRFEADAVMRGWVEKEEQALARGFDGLRLTGNTFWLDKADWQAFADYEATIDRVIGDHRMLGLCAYSLDKCGASEIMDVVCNHQFALIQRKGRWEIIGSAERQRAKGQLRETRDFLHKLINHANAPIIVWDPEHRITRFNHAFELLTGHTAREVIGQELHMLFPPATRDESLGKIARALDGEHWESVEIPILRKDGDSRVALWNSANMYAEDGTTLLATTAQVHDITERKRAEDALRASETKYRTLAENLPQKIFLKDRNSVYLSCNENYARDLQVTPDEIAGKTDFDFHPRELAEKYSADDARVVESGKTEEIEETYIQGGQVFWVHTVKTPVRDESGNVAGVLGIFWDITERKQAEEALGKAHDELEERVAQRTRELAAANEALQVKVGERERAEEEIQRLNADLKHRLVDLNAVNKELESFSYSVSHDLRAPLRAVEGFGKALLEDCADGLDEHGKHCVDRIRAGSQHMAELIEDLLRLSRVTATEMSHETVDLGEMAREAAAELRKSQPERRVECVIADGLIAEGDRHLLRVLLRHLLDNAWKFTSKHPTARMEFGATQAEDGRVFFVRDDGAGLDMAYAGKLFAPFQRLHSQAEFPGTGIGLATVQRIVRRHGGRVWVEAAVEQGATFYFTLQGRAT